MTNCTGYTAQGGSTSSSDGDIAINNGVRDFWLVKIDTIGNIIWEKTFGSIYGDDAHEAIQSSDGGFIIVGWGNGNLVNATCSYAPGNGWLVKTDSFGNLQWQNCYGGSTPTDIITSIRQLNNGDYVFAALTGSNDGAVSGNHGYFDAWLVRVNINGNIIWQKCFGGSIDETASSLEVTNDNGYIFTGRTGSNDGDVSGNHSADWDYWVVKLAPDTITGIANFGLEISSLKINPNPNDGNFIINYSLPQNKNGTLEIFNVIGDRVYSQPLPQWSMMQEINLSALTTGIYNCVITSGNERVNKKIAVMKE